MPSTAVYFNISLLIMQKNYFNVTKKTSKSPGFQFFCDYSSDCNEQGLNWRLIHLSSGREEKTLKTSNRWQNYFKFHKIFRHLVIYQHSFSVSLDEARDFNSDKETFFQRCHIVLKRKIIWNFTKIYTLMNKFGKM